MNPGACPGSDATRLNECLAIILEGPLTLLRERVDKISPANVARAERLPTAVLQYHRNDLTRTQAADRERDR